MQEIANLQRKRLKLHQEVQHAKDQAKANLKFSEHKNARKALRWAINQSKVHSWRQLEDRIQARYQKLGVLKSSNPMEAVIMERITGSLRQSRLLKLQIDV